MLGPVFHAGLGSPARAGWSAVVNSMEAAFSDPTHIIVLGIVVGSVIVIYANYKVARWIERKSEQDRNSP